MIVNHIVSLNNATQVIKLPKGFYHWVRIFDSTNAAAHSVAQVRDSEQKPTAITDGSRVVIFQQKNTNAHDETPDGSYPVESPWLVIYTAGNLTLNVLVSMSNSEIAGTNRTNKK